MDGQTESDAYEPTMLWHWWAQKVIYRFKCFLKFEKTGVYDLTLVSFGVHSWTKNGGGTFTEANIYMWEV